MKGTIIKIHPIKHSRNGNAFIRIEFQMEDGRWAKTDICPDYRNYQRWKDYLTVGLSLDGLELKKTGFVNADSFPEPVKHRRRTEYRKMPNGDMQLVELEDEPQIVVEDIYEPLPEIGGVQEKLL